MAGGDYWNHNTAYYPWLMSLAERRRGNVLDVGCGDGLLLRRLAGVSSSVTGIEPDPSAAQRAVRRLGDLPDAEVVPTSFQSFDPGPRRFDLVTFVATLHHMDARRSLAQARALLSPSGMVAVIGLSANATVGDWLWSAACLPAVRLGSKWHRETRDIGVAVTDPEESLREIRSIATEVLPGSVVRRRVYYRYSLLWSAPAGDT